MFSRSNSLIMTVSWLIASSANFDGSLDSAPKVFVLLPQKFGFFLGIVTWPVTASFTARPGSGYCSSNQFEI